MLKLYAKQNKIKQRKIKYNNKWTIKSVSVFYPEISKSKKSSVSFELCCFGGEYVHIKKSNYQILAVFWKVGKI